MRAQGQTADGESHMGQSARNSNGKMASTSQYSCQRAKRCSALEPVLEHCELVATTMPACEAILQQQGTSSTQKGRPYRILSRLRDGYVKLMNDVASGADLAGVSSFYGAGFGGPCAGDYAGLTAKTRTINKETEKEQRFGSQSAGA